MTEELGNPRSANIRRGCFGWMALIAFVVITSVFFLRSRSNPYSRAIKIRDADPCKAAALFAEDVRRDWRGSIISLRELSRIEDDCAFDELIGLMDLPDGRQINVNYRNMIAESIAQRTEGATPPHPAYNPAAPVEIRTQQKSEWTNWRKFRKTNPVSGK